MARAWDKYLTREIVHSWRESIEIRRSLRMEAHMNVPQLEYDQVTDSLTSEGMQDTMMALQCVLHNGLGAMQTFIK